MSLRISSVCPLFTVHSEFLGVSWVSNKISCNATFQEGQMEESEDDDSDLDEDFGVGQLTHD